MELTNDQLKRIMPTTTAARRAEALPIINACCRAYDINNERRMAAFLATLAAESGELKYQEEIASGAAYEGRSDLGNNQKGDGRKFKGHGRIQITGRDNHTKYTNYLKRSKHLPFVDFVANPKALAVEPYATDAAGWFWTVYKKLNPIADRGDFLTTQIRVNGRNKKTGLPNHYDVRQRYYTRALSVLPDNFKLDSAATPTPSNSAEPSDQITAVNPVEPTEQPPILHEGTVETTVIDGSPVVEKTTDTAGTVAMPIAATYKDVGLFAVLKKDFAAVGGGNLSFQLLQEYATQASGLPAWVISLIVKLATIAIVLGIAWLLFRFGHYVIWKIGEYGTRKTVLKINADPTMKDVA